MKRGIISILALAACIFLNVTCNAQQQPASVDAKELKEITDASKSLFSEGKVREIKVFPSEKGFFTEINKEWLYNLAAGKPEHHRQFLILVPLSNRIPPTQSLKLKSLKSTAEKLNKWDYELVRLYSMQKPEDPSLTDLVAVCKDNILFATYRQKDKYELTIPLEDLSIAARPALFFSYGEDKDGKFVKILVVDEDQVSVLHRPGIKAAVFKYYPAAMKVSSYGAINTQPRGMNLLMKR